MAGPIPRGEGDERRFRAAVSALVSPTKKFSMSSTATETFTVPADGSASAASNAQNIRAILRVLADKGILSLEET